MRTIRTLSGDPRRLLPAATGGADVLRLMLAVNLLSSLVRHAMLRMRTDAPAARKLVTEFGDQVAVIAFTGGVLKEGVDAFWCAEPYLSPLYERNRDQVDGDRYKRFKGLAQKTDQSSLYCRLIKPIRDEAAFHWNRTRLEEYLSLVKSVNAPIMKIYNENDEAVVARYVLADVIVSLVMFGNESDADIRRRVSSLRDFVDLFMAIAEEAVALFLREHGAVVSDEPAN